MDIPLKVFLVEDDSIRELPIEKMEKITAREEALEECSGKTVKYVLVYLVNYDGFSYMIGRMEGRILYFDENGYIDEERRRDEIQLILQRNMCDTSPSNPGSPVVKAKDKFLKKRFLDQYTWEPDARTVEKITEILTSRPRRQR